MTWAVSEEDAGYFRSLAHGRVEVVPNGAHFGSAVPRPEPTDHLRLLFIGSLAYSANRDALREFATRWAPRIDVPWTLSVVGSGMLDADTRVKLMAHSNVTIQGYVEDVKTAYQTHDVLVAPIRQAGGTRLKVLEAGSNLLPIVATDIAVEGTGLIPGGEYFLADTAEAAAEALRSIYLDRNAALYVASAARRKIERFCWPAIGDAADALLKIVADNHSL
ncbi:MAG: glycosyltransferase family 4 protein [Actinomycetota bacterium]